MQRLAVGARHRDPRRSLGIWIGLSLLSGLAALAAAPGQSPSNVATTNDDHDRAQPTNEPQARPETTTTAVPVETQPELPPTVPPTIAPTRPPAVPAGPPEPPAAPVVTITERGLWVVRVDGSDAIHLPAGGGAGTWWSPDSNALYSLRADPGGGTLLRIGLDGTVAEVTIPPGPTPDGQRPRRIVAADVAGGYLAFGWVATEGIPWAGIAIMALDSGVPVELAEERAGTLSVAANGLLAISAADLWIHGPDGATVAGPFDAGNGLSGDWSPDGTQLIVGSNDPCILEITTGTCHGEGIALGNVQRLEYAPDSRRLVIETLEPAGDRLSLVVSEPGGQPRLLVEDGGTPLWDPTGETIAFDHSPYRTNRNGDATLELINPDGTGQRTLLRTTGVVVNPLAWSPDGQWIALGA